MATLFGTATALGLNGLQLNSGLDYLFDVPKSNTVAVLIIIAVTTLFLISATSGVEKGINFLANLGSFATIGLFLFFLVAGGSTVLIISNGIESIGNYVIQVLPMSLQTGVGDEQWMAGWTIFYWAWWVSWAPFVGMFVARISRGRTIREFIIGVVAAPTGFGFFWFAVVGGVGIELERSGKADIVGSLATPGAVPVHGARRAAAARGQLRALRLPDRALLHQRRRRGLGRDGDDGLARLAAAVEVRRRRAGRADGRHRLRDAARRWPDRPATGGRARVGAVHRSCSSVWRTAGSRRCARRPGRRTRSRDPSRTDRGQGRSGHVRSAAAPARPGRRGAGRTAPWRAARPTTSATPPSSRRARRCGSRSGPRSSPRRRILGELWRQALAVNGYTVNLRKGVGPAEDLDQALKDGDIDGYVAYTGTVLSIVAGEEVSGLDPDETYERAKEFYAGQDMVMSEMTPFENKDAIATTTTFAEENDLTAIGDLAGLDSFVLGARPEFEDLQLGLAGLQEVYGLDNATFAPIELGEQYAALDSGEADAVDAFTTDPQLETGDYTLLDDPELLFGSQNVVMVVGEDKLDSIDADAFMNVVDTVNAELSEDAMVQMNAEVTDGRSDELVAREFLRSVGLDEPLRGDD